MDAKLSQNYRFKIFLFYSLIIFLLFDWVCISAIVAYFIISLSHDYSRLWLLAFFPLLYALSAVVAFICYTMPKFRGLSVTKELAPELFSLIENTVNKLGYKGSINEVVLTSGMSVEVYYNPNLVNFIEESNPKLYIGVNLCRILSNEELSAVIAHELAHLHQPQTKYKAYLARLSNTSSILEKNGFWGVSSDESAAVFSFYAYPARILCKFFNSVFKGFFDINSAEYQKITAEMELEADNASAQVFGAEVMLSALCKSFAVSRRMTLYKKLVLPYILSYGFRCNEFWNTFEASSSFFKSIDGLDIIQNKKLLNLNRENSDLSERIITLRYDTLKQQCAENNNSPGEAIIIDIIPADIQKKMDDYLCRKYGHDSGILISTKKLREILDGLRSGLFADVSSMYQADAIVDDLYKEVSNIEPEVQHIVLPENVSPTCMVLPTPLALQPTDYIYSSSLEHCPVCGHKISEDIKICPHCLEVISE